MMKDLFLVFCLMKELLKIFKDIEKIEKQGDEVGDYNLQNKIEATINNNKNIDIGKLKETF